MSCYLRHLRPLFDALDLEYDKANRARVDVAIREILGMTGDESCPQVWSRIKELSPRERDDLPGEVAHRLGNGSGT